MHTTSHYFPKKSRTSNKRHKHYIKAQDDLRINSKKTKAFRLNSETIVLIKIHGLKLADVDTYTHLGGIITTKGRADDDIKHKRRS